MTTITLIKENTLELTLREVPSIIILAGSMEYLHLDPKADKGRLASTGT